MNTFRLLSILFAAIALALSTSVAGDGDQERFGPYVAIERDANIVKDVKVTDTGRVYLLLNPDFKEREIILKNSSGYKDGYRKWFNGEFELVSPPNQGKAPNEYTDWVETTGNFIEYYMDGKLILHLGKADVYRAN